MKAVEYAQCGGPEVLALVTRPDPACGPGMVLVANEAVSVNPVDAKIRAGLYPGMPKRLPAGTGRDGAGVIQAVGAGVDPGRIGRRVCYLAQRGAPSWAERVVLPAEHAEDVPDGLGPAEAASLPLAGVSAWAGLVEAGGLAAGERVLIHAAAGGVGGLAVQIARALGATVWAVCSSPNADHVSALGADHLILRDRQAFEAACDGMDLVFDLVGGETRARSRKVLRPSGRLVGLNALPFGTEHARADITERMAEVQPGTGALRAVLDLVAAGRVRPDIGAVLPFSAYAEAHRRIETGRTRGKIVLTLPG